MKENKPHFKVFELKSGNSVLVRKSTYARIGEDDNQLFLRIEFSFSSLIAVYSFCFKDTEYGEAKIDKLFNEINEEKLEKMVKEINLGAF